MPRLIVLLGNVSVDEIRDALAPQNPIGVSNSIDFAAGTFSGHDKWEGV
jgi:hypothetical protein